MTLLLALTASAWSAELLREVLPPGEGSPEVRAELALSALPPLSAGSA